LYEVCDLAGAEWLWRRPKKGEGQMLCSCATDWEDIISVSMWDPGPFRLRGGTYVSEHSILITWPSQFKLGNSLAALTCSEIWREGGDTSHEMLNVGW
jgi:hypothetical protein